MAESTQTTVAAEKAKLLPRSMGILTTTVFAVATISLASTGLVPFSSILGHYPGIPLLAILGVGALICALNAYVYAVIGAAVRRSGADYILASRVISPFLAFAFSWSMVLFAALVLGKIIAQIGQSVLPVFMRTISIIVNAPGMVLSADAVSAPEGVAFASSLMIVLAFVFSILPPRLGQRIMLVGFLLVLLGWAVIYFQLLLPAAPFQQAWDHFMGSGSFAAQIPAARDAGMSTAPGPVFWEVGLLVAFWLFYGFQSPAFLAGEIKRPQRSLIVGSLGSLILALAVIGLATNFLFHLVPQEWLAAQSYLYISGKSAMPWITYYAAILRPDAFLVSFLTLAWIFSFLNVVQAYITFSSRIILAWQEDGLLPRAFGYVHPQLTSPVIAVLTVAILTQAGALAAALNSVSISADFGFIFFAILSQIFPVFAAFLMPFLKKEWFATQSRFIRLGIGPLPLVSIASLGLLIYFGWLLFKIFSTPGMIAQGLISIILFGIVFFTGMGYFFLRRLALGGSGSGLDGVFRSFPDPEEK